MDDVKQRILEDRPLIFKGSHMNIWLTFRNASTIETVYMEYVKEFMSPETSMSDGLVIAENVLLGNGVSIVCMEKEELVLRENFRQEKIVIREDCEKFGK